MASQKTGKNNSNKNEVTKIDHTKSVNLCIDKSNAHIINIVVIKFIETRIETAPNKCKLIIAKSAVRFERAGVPIRGGYALPPVPASAFTLVEESSSKEGDNNQK